MANSNLGEYDVLNPNFLFKKLALDNGSIGLADIRYIKDIVNTKVSMFSYEGLPNELTPQILELCLIFRNNLCFWFNKGTQLWQLCYYTYSSEFNYYLKPVKVCVVAINGRSMATDIPYEDIILVRDNTMDILPIVPITQYIARMKNIEATIDQQLSIISLPVILVCNEKTKTQMKAITDKAGIKSPFVLGDKTMVDGVKSFNISVPISPLDLYELRSKYRNECLQSLGIYSVDEKRERLLEQEVTNQNDFTETIYQGMKKQRLDFIKELNARSEGKLNVKLIELYAMGVKDEVKEEQDKAKANAKGEAEGVKEVDPNAQVGKGGGLNGN